MDLTDADNVTVLMTARFDDETWYGFGNLLVKVKEDNRLPPLKYEQWFTLESR